MKSEGKKEVTVSLSIEVDNDLSHEQIASKLEEAIKHLDDKVSRLSDVTVRTVPRFQGLPGDRMAWEKATCNISKDPRRRIRDPIEQVTLLEDTVVRMEKDLNAVKETLRQLGR